MPQQTIELLKKGIQACEKDSFRKDNLINLPAQGELIITGDIHGHRRNFERIVQFAALDRNPQRHLILQEIIHGGPVDTNDNCLSFNLLLDVIRYKLEFTDRVHIIMGNHDVAFISNSEVMKDGKEMNRSFKSALDLCFEENSKLIKESISEFLFSLPLAVKCENRIWISHSLPSDRNIESFDPEIFERPLKLKDLDRKGSVYALTWGRKHSQKALNELAELFDIDFFILGHQTQKQGYLEAGDNLIILISEHNHGCLMKIDLSSKYTMEKIIDSIIPLASIK